MSNYQNSFTQFKSLSTIKKFTWIIFRKENTNLTDQLTIITCNGCFSDIPGFKESSSAFPDARCFNSCNYKKDFMIEKKQVIGENERG